MRLISTPRKNALFQDRQPLFIHEDTSQITPHDLLFKKLIQDFFEQFVEVFFPKFHQAIDFDSVTFLSGEIVADTFHSKRRELDIVIEAQWKSTDSMIIIHVEPQSYEQSKFNERMYHYYSLLYGKFRKPIIPIAIFTYDAPRYDEQFSIEFLEEKIVQFKYYALHLRELNWRDFMRKENPVSAVLLSKMGYNDNEKVQVKLEFLRILATLKLDQAKQSFLYRFFEIYLELTPDEEGELMTKIEKDKETFDISSLPISFIERGKRIGREEAEERVVLRMLRENLPIDLIMKLTDFDEDKIKELREKI